MERKLSSPTLSSNGDSVMVQIFTEDRALQARWGLGSRGFLGKTRNEVG